MKITMLGVVMALKNLGFWLSTTWILVDIKANPEGFMYAFLIYALINIPSDLYLMNKAHESGQNEGKPQ